MAGRNGKPNYTYGQIVRVTCLALAIFIFTSVGLLLYGSTTDYFKSKLIETEYANMLQLSQKLDIYLDNLKNLSESISRSQMIISQLDRLEGASQPTDYNEVLQEIQRFLLPISGYTRGINSVTILTRERVYSHNGPSLLSYDYDALVQILATRQDDAPLFVCSTDEYESALIVRDRANSLAYTGESEPCVMRLIHKGEAVLGVLIIRISDSEMIKYFPDGAVSFLWDGKDVVWGKSKGETAFTDWTSLASKGVQDSLGSVRQGNNFLFYRQLAVNDWVLYYASGWEKLPATIIGSFTYLGLSLVISFGISFLLTSLLIRQTIRPLYNMAAAAQSFILGSDTVQATLEQKKLNYSLRDRIMVQLMLVILVPLCLFAVFYFFNTSSTMTRELTANKSQSIVQMDENIEITLDSRLGALRTLSFDSVIQESLITGGRVDDARVHAAIEDYLPLLGRYYNLSVYMLDGNPCYSTIDNAASHHAGCIAEVAASPQSDHWSGAYPGRTGIDLISLTLKIISIDNEHPHQYLQPIGYIVLDLEEHALSDIFLDAASSQTVQIYMTNGSGLILSAYDKSRIGRTPDKIDANAEVSFQYGIRNTDWILTGNFPVTAIRQDVTDFLYGKFYMLPLAALLLIVISFELSRLLTQPMNRIARLMRRLKFKDTDLVFPVEESITEINQLTEAFNEMLARIHRLTDEKVEAATRQARLEKEKKDAEVTSLQSQIKPHFLCNTLDVVRCLISSNEKGDASRLLREISNLFRFGISKQETIILINQEISYTKAYAAIMMTRFTDRLKIEWDIQPGLDDYLVMKMLLQPLVENAIEHGIIPRKEPGRVLVSCRRQDGKITFSVKDDGVGMDAQTVSNLLAAIARGDHSDWCVGLRNVKQRLDIYYGGEAEIIIRSEKWQGTKIIIRIPEMTKVMISVNAPSAVDQKSDSEKREPRM